MLALYIARRFLLTVPAMLAMSVIVFMMIRLIPGDPALVILGLRSSPENIPPRSCICAPRPGGARPNTEQCCWA